MNRLYIVRHGVAVPQGTPGIADEDRPLTQKGERRIRQVGHALRWLDTKVDRIVSSPLPRALRTAEIVADALGATEILETSDALRAERDASSIREWLRSRPEDSLMIVGHNPALSDLVGLLITGASGDSVCELRKGGVAAIAAVPGGGLAIEWLARPRLFRRLLR